MSTAAAQPSPTDENGPGATASPPPLASRGRIWLLLVGAGVLAGLISWSLGEATYNIISPRTHLVSSRGKVALNITDRWGQNLAAIQNATLAFAILGGVLGIGTGLAGGLTGRATRRAWAGAAVGLGAGALGQAVLSVALLYPYGAFRFYHPDEASNDLVFPILVHAGVWAGAGATAGLAYSLGLGHRRRAGRAALAGAVGAALGSAVFLVAEALVLPDGDTTQFVSSTRGARLAARLAVTVLTTVGIAAAMTRGRSPLVAVDTTTAKD